MHILITLQRRYKNEHPVSVTEVSIYQPDEKIAHDAVKAGLVKFVFKENGGLGDARNFGIALAKGTISC